MKGKKFYIILVSLIAIGFTSLFLFRQQQEARYLEFEGYEIVEIEERVNELYNEEKTDIIEDISMEELEEIDVTILDLKEKDFSKRSERRLADVELDYLMAEDMREIELDIQDLFVESDIVDQNASIEKVENLEEQVTTYEIKPVYYERNTKTLEEAKQQIIDIETAKAFIDELFEEDDVVREDVTREEEEEALELISNIRNEEVKEALVGRVEVVSLVLTETEEALALQKELEALEAEQLDEDEELEEEPTEYTAPSDNQNSGSSESTWTPPRRSQQPTWTPRRPVDPKPKNPVKSPKDPVDSTRDPVEPPKDPVDPPKDPIEPPKDPVDPPKDPIEPPKDPIEPPKDPIEPPKDPVDPPKDPID